MSKRKLEKLKRELEGLRGRPQKPAKLESLARRLGRTRVKRGSEPNWKSEWPGVYPVSIPHHGGKDIPPGTVNSILDQLEEDLLALEVKFANNGHGRGRDEDNG